VIHGGTGLSDDQFRGLIERGVTKINYYTALSDAAAARIRENLAGSERGGYTALVKGIQAPMQAEMERCIHLWGAAGRAEELLAACEPWTPVDHLIVYNLDEGTDPDELMAEGRRVLGAIPGVREVFTGTSVREDAAYRHCWLVRFADAAVIDTYRDHPDHRAFADGHFRPLATDRLTIDYQLDP
jgi:fructose-bisphosphate aldolase, class II